MMHLPELICNCSNKEWESLKITKKKISYIESQVKKLTDTLVAISHRRAKIQHSMLFIIIDGKVPKTKGAITSNGTGKWEQ